MALGLQALGVTCCLATAAVGSLRPSWTPGTFVVPHDLLDLTGRNPTLFDQKVVHTDFSSPLPARAILLSGAASSGTLVEDGGIYICGNGPRYETPHEIALFAKVGDLVGMTAATEAILMREAGVDYGLLAVVTNLACGLSDAPLNHGEVADEMERIGETAVKVLLASVGGLRSAV
jgi:5'-methylthioadenosine phosphorylase